MIERHIELHQQRARATGARQLGPARSKRFVRVMPRDYKRMLACIARAHEQGLTGDEAIMVAFEENARDLLAVGGN